MPWDKQFDRDKVLRKAMEAFWEKGYAATSMQDLVDCTGVNRASLYATYGDKKELFLATLRLYDLSLRKALLENLDQRPSPRAAIRELLEGFTEMALAKGKCRGCYLTNTSLELAAHDAEVRRIVAAAQADTESFFLRKLEQGQAKKEFSPALDPAAGARALLAALLGLLVLARSRPDRVLLQSIIEEALGRLR
jgi:TetR/AcrR family transcriptional repressor of nem operon